MHESPIHNQITAQIEELQRIIDSPFTPVVDKCDSMVQQNMVLAFRYAFTFDPAYIDRQLVNEKTILQLTPPTESVHILASHLRQALNLCLLLENHDQVHLIPEIHRHAFFVIELADPLNDFPGVPTSFGAIARTYLYQMDKFQSLPAARNTIEYALKALSFYKTVPHEQPFITEWAVLSNIHGAALTFLAAHENPLQNNLAANGVFRDLLMVSKKEEDHETMVIAANGLAVTHLNIAKLMPGSELAHLQTARSVLKDVYESSVEYPIHHNKTVETMRMLDFLIASVDGSTVIH